jgi:hypothetical protein
MSRSVNYEPFMELDSGGPNSSRMLDQRCRRYSIPPTSAGGGSNASKRPGHDSRRSTKPIDRQYTAGVRFNSQRHR